MTGVGMAEVGLMGTRLSSGRSECGPESVHAIFVMQFL